MIVVIVVTGSIVEEEGEGSFIPMIVVIIAVRLATMLTIVSCILGEEGGDHHLTERDHHPDPGRMGKAEGDLILEASLVQEAAPGDEVTPDLVAEAIPGHQVEALLQDPGLAQEKEIQDHVHQKVIIVPVHDRLLQKGASQETDLHVRIQDRLVKAMVNNMLY